MKRAALLTALLSALALAQTAESDLAKTLEPLKDHIVALREPARGKDLRFDAVGARQKGKTGSWANDVYVRVVAIEVAPDRIVLRGKRRDAGVVQESAVPVAVPTVVPMSVDRADVKIEIATAPGRAGLAAAMQRIFLGSQEKIDVSSIRRCWRDPSAAAALPAANTPAGQFVGKVGAGINAPHPLRTPDPSYSDEARRERVQGAVTLWTVISAEGRPTEVCVVQSLGYGLDEEAIDAVRQWRFEPARKGGVPVAVQVNIEVNFRLY